jgi:hypothetical protein
VVRLRKTISMERNTMGRENKGLKEGILMNQFARSFLFVFSAVLVRV